MGEQVTPKSFAHYVGSVFNNAKDWDGGRVLRKVAAAEKGMAAYKREDS